jgi:hypothetical protein
MYTSKGNRKKGKRAAKQLQNRDKPGQAQPRTHEQKPPHSNEVPHPDDVAVEDEMEEKEDHGHAEFIYKNIFYEWFYRVGHR